MHGKPNDDLLGLRQLDKITMDHVKLRSHSRMTVKLAAQVRCFIQHFLTERFEKYCNLP